MSCVCVGEFCLCIAGQIANVGIYFTHINGVLMTKWVNDGILMGMCVFV